MRSSIFAFLFLFSFVSCLALSVNPVSARATSVVSAESSLFQEPPAEAPSQSFHQVIKEQFIAGDWRYMLTVLLCLIFGLAISLERIITLNLASINVKKFIKNLERLIQSGKLDRAKQLCADTRGPVASICTQGLLRIDEKTEVLERSVIAYGSVEMGKLEQGMTWISLFISLAPMLGFMGTVIGMISAFDAIAAAGDVSPSLVADGIKIALLTTVGGLIVAIILQLFYNYIVSKIDALVNAMEDASISFVDLAAKYNQSQE